jgi:Mor family transcriptional regulator
MRIADAADVSIEELERYINHQRLNVSIAIHPSNGNNNPLRKLTDIDAAMIRARYANREQTGVTMRSLAKEYGVSAQTISNVVHQLSHITVIELVDSAQTHQALIQELDYFKRKYGDPS